MELGLKQNDDAQLTGRATSGAALLICARLMTKSFDFLTLLILARLLNPMEFGIVAIAMTMIFIIEAVLELPVNQVLVSLFKIERDHMDTAFTLGALRGLILAIGLSILAVPFSHFYHDPRLTWLIAILSIAPAMRGLSSPRLAVYASRMDFRRDFAIELSGKFASFALSTSAAVILRDYRAIVIGILATPTTMAIASYILAPYRPRLSLKAWPLFAHFLGWTSASQLLSALNWQCDRLILGRFVPRMGLGEFSLANDLSYLPEQALINPILRPLMSAFTLVRHDPERLDLAYAKTSNSILAVGMPVMVGLSLLAGPAVRFALGGKWIASIPILQWLSLTLIPPLLIAPLPSLAMALGKPQINLRRVAAEAATKMPLIIPGAMFFGIQGVIVARAVSAALAAFISLFYVRQLIGTPVWRQLAGTWRIVVCGLVLALFLLAVRGLLDNRSELVTGLLLALVAAAGLAIYSACLGLSWHLVGRPHGLEAAASQRIKILMAKLKRRRHSPT